MISRKCAIAPTPIRQSTNRPTGMCRTPGVPIAVLAERMAGCTKIPGLRLIGASRPLQVVQTNTWNSNMRCFEKGNEICRAVSSISAALIVVGMLSSSAALAEGETKTKKSSSRQSTQKLACDRAQESALKLADLDCGTGGGIMTSPKMSDCNCEPMGGKWLCSVKVTYRCD